MIIYERDFLLRAYLRDCAYLFASGNSYFIPLTNAKNLYRGRK